MRKLKVDNGKKILQALSPRRIILPIFIGLGVAAFLLFRNFQPDQFSFFEWSITAALWIFVSVLMMVVRDFAYIVRIKLLTDHHLSWRQAFEIIMLWEFSSAISPSVVGGTAPAIYFLFKEKISAGKSTAVVLVAIFLDELFFILAIPILLLFFGNRLFPSTDLLHLSQLKYYFWFGYGLIFLYTLLLGYAIFINPHIVKTILKSLFRFPLIKRWQEKACLLSDQLIETSKWFKTKDFKFWIKTFTATVFSWTGRYAVINFMFMAFFLEKLKWTDHFLIYARQLSMWILLLVSPTPGGSGLAEIFFKDFLRDFIPNLSWVIPLALLWRLISYYPYLFLGAIILPRWMNRVFKKKKD
ncbi:MAG: flippase-like domain-containing protein [Bacteroidales bacterium]|nr:flippase-like domain-containing protein [Bacteroidales bacterium]